MTRLAILADVHGNLPALQAVIADMAQFDVDHVVIAGDAIHRGPFSAEVVELVLREGWAVIRGNNEFYLLDYNTTRAPAAWNKDPLIVWLYDQLKGHLHHRIASWPDTISLRFSDAPPIRVVHGTPQDVRGFLHADWPDDDEVAALLADVDESVLIGGHIHLTLDRRVDRWRILNPGAVGMSFDGNRDASYMILNSEDGEWEPTFRRVGYDIERVFAEYERLDFVERFGVIARLIVEELRIARPLVGPFRHWRRENYPDTSESMALVEEFLASDWEPYMIDEYRLDKIAT